MGALPNVVAAYLLPYGRPRRGRAILCDDRSNGR